MKTKVLNFFSAIKYQLIVFVLLMGQAIYTMTSFRIGNVGEFMTVYYLVDLSMLKASRTWVGTVVSLLTDHPTQAWINGFAAVMLLLAIVITSVLVGKVIKNVESEIRPQALIAALFLTTGTFTFYMFSVNFGFLDVHLFIIALVSVVFLNNKVLRWLVPALCVAGFLTHQLFVVMYFPLIILVAMYITVAEKRGRISKSAVFVLSIASVAVVALWTLANGPDTNIYTPEQMLEVIEAKGMRQFSQDAFENMRWQFFYIPTSEYSEVFPMEELENYSLWEYVKGWLYYTNVLRGFSLHKFLSVFSFVGAFSLAMWAIWIMCIRNTESKLKKLVFVCFMLAVFAAPIGCIIAVDYIRWCQAAVLCQFGFLFFMFYVKDEAFKTTMAQLGAFFKDKKLLLVIAFVVYIMTVQIDVG